MLALDPRVDHHGVSMELSVRERAILDFERTWWCLPACQPGTKGAAIRQQLNLSSTRYYEMLTALLDDPAALQYDPLTVKRAQRARLTRRRARVEGPSADGRSR
jgi:hypothetical protein